MGLVNKALKLRTGNVAHLGDVQFGAPGGSRNSVMFTLSYDIADELARELGCDAETAHRTVIAFGKCAQKLLLKGSPVGIPHLGTLALTQIRRGFNHGLSEYNRKRDGKTSIDDVSHTPIVRRIKFVQPLKLRRLFMDNALYSGSLIDHKKAAKQKLINKLGTWRAGGLRHRGKSV